MASITNPRRGVYVAQVFIGRDDQGRTIRKSRTFHGSKREADREIAAWERALLSGPASKRVLGATTPFVEVMDLCIDAHRGAWSDAHTHSFTNTRNRLAETPLGDRPIAQVTKAEVARFLIDESKIRNPRTGRQRRATVTNYRQHISKTFSFAVDAELIHSSPMPRASMIPLERGDRVEDRDLASVLEIMTATAAVDITPMQALMINLVLATGLRRGELLGLRYGDFNRHPDGGATLTVRRQVKDVRTKERRALLGGATFEVAPTKTRKARRLWVDPATMALIDDAQITQSADRLAHGLGPVGPGDWLFTDDWIDPLHPATPSVWWGKIRTAAGLPPDLRLQDLRHVHVTALIGAGVDVRTVAARVGHHPNVTFNSYAHAIPATDRAAGEVIAAQLHPRP